MAEVASTGTRSFDLEVISPERVLEKTRARSIVATAADGQVGVMYNHAPLVSALVPGTLKVTPENGAPYLLATGEGFLEVVDNKVRVLVDTAERAEQIDVGRAQAAKKRAEERLAKSRAGDKEIDYVRADAAVRRAIARLRVTGSL